MLNIKLEVSQKTIDKQNLYDRVRVEEKKKTKNRIE